MNELFATLSRHVAAAGLGMPMTAATIAPAPGPAGAAGSAAPCPYLLLLPGLLWLLVFYVLPAVQMFTYSLSTGNARDGFEFTGSLDAYVEAIDRVRPAVPQLDDLRRPRDAVHVPASGSRSPTRSRSAAGATRT